MAETTKVRAPVLTREPEVTPALEPLLPAPDVLNFQPLTVQALPDGGFTWLAQRDGTMLPGEEEGVLVAPYDAGLESELDHWLASVTAEPTAPAETPEAPTETSVAEAPGGGPLTGAVTLTVAPVGEERNGEPATQAGMGVAPVEEEPAPPPEGEPEPAEDAGEVAEESDAEVAGAEAELEAPPAESTADATAAELSAWREKMRASTSAIEAGNLASGEAGAESLRAGGSAGRAGRLARRGDLAKQAQDAVSEAPKAGQPVQPPEEVHPVPEAPKLVKDKSNLPLPDQRMPELVRSAKGNMPVLGEKPTPPTPPPPPPEVTVLERVGPAKDAKPDPNKARADNVKKTAEEPAKEEPAPEPADPLVIKDIPPPPRPPLPAPAVAAVGATIANLLAEVDIKAKGILDEARKPAYQGQMLIRYPNLADDELPGLTEAVTTELRMVAQQAGVSDDELNARVKDRQAELEKRKAEEAAKVAGAGEAEKQATKDAAQEEADAVKAAKDSVDKSTERKTEATAGANDPTVVRAKRDRLKDAISESVGQQRQFYDAAVQRRQGQLQYAENVQVLAYRAVVQREEIEAMKLEPGQSFTLKQGLSAAESRLWGKEQERVLRIQVSWLEDMAKRFGDYYKTEVTNAGTTAREQIDSWAQGILKEQESWWDRLFAMFRDWMVTAKAESHAWAQVRAGQTRDAMLMDFVFLDGQVKALGENVDLEAIKARKDISEEQKAVLLAYYSEGPDAKNPVAAVAAGTLMRISQARRPELIQRFDRLLMDRPADEWELLDAICRTQNPAFNAAKLADDLYAAMKGGVTGWGTDEAAIFAALNNLTPLQGATIRKAYRAIGYGDLDAHLDDELSGAEYTRAKAQLEANQAVAIAAELNYAMHGGITGWGTDEESIMAALRNKSAEERKAIEAEYLRLYGKTLHEEFDDEMSSHDFDRAEALREGDVAKADAIALDQAMRGGILGWGTDEKAIEGTYKTIRQEVIAEGATKKPPWNTAQVNAEVKRRNIEVEASYNKKYGGDWEQSEESALRQAFKSEMQGPELDLSLAMADNDLVKADAARIAIEAQSVFYTSDNAVNGVLEDQYKRALEDTRRDGAGRIEALEKEAREAKPPWDAYELERRKRLLERQFEEEAKGLAKQNMTALESTYNSKYQTWYGGGLNDVIDKNLSGVDREKGKKLLEQNGYLSPAQQIHYAVEGIGTREEALKDALKGRTAAEIQQIREEWNELHPDEPLDERIASETSGRDDFDTRMLLKGVPENADQEIALKREQAKYELDNSATSGSSVQRKVLEGRMKKLEEQYKVIQSAPEGPERTKAIALFKQRSGYVDSAVESYRKQVDAVTDTIATVAAITAAVVVAAVLTVLTAGAAGPAIAALAATLGTSTLGLTAGAAAVAALAATIITKQVMLGGAYGWEDIGVDLAVGGVEIAAAVATAGMGNALVKAGRAGRLAMMAGSKSRVTRMLAFGLAEGAEGVISSFPGALAGSVLNDKNWEHGDPFANIAMGTAIGTGMGTLMSAGMGTMHGIKAVGPPKVTPPSSDILAQMGTPEGRLAQWKAYKLENPNASMQTFLTDLQAGAARRLAGEEASQKMLKQLRTDLLSGLEPKQRGALGKVPMEVLSEADFARLARGQTGPAALITVGGTTKLIVREGTDPKALRSQGDLLARSVVRDAQGRPVHIDSVLPRDLRGRVPVQIDPDLTGNTVRVLYDIDPKTGLVGNIRMLAGPGATAVDLQLHARTARMMERYSGFMGRARQMLDRFKVWAGANGSPPPGSKAWEASLEVDKLPRIIEDRLLRLRDADLTPALRKELMADIADLQRQLDRYERILRDMEVTPGKGFVAAEARVTSTADAALQKTPTVRDVAQAVAADAEWQKVKYVAKVVDVLEANPTIMTPGVFDKVLRNVPKGANKFNFIGELYAMVLAVGRLSKRSEDVSGAMKIIDGLASDVPHTREAADFMLRMANKVPTRELKTHAKDTMLAAAEIFKKFDLEDIRLIRNQHGTSNEYLLFNSLVNLTRRTEGMDGAAIRRVINEAGAVASKGELPKPDIYRLQAIIETLPPGNYNEAQLLTAIRRQNDLDETLRKLGSNVVAGLEAELGISRNAKDLFLPLSTVPTFLDGTEVSGTKLSKFFRDEKRIERIIKDMVDAAGEVSEARWLVLQKALRDPNVDPILTNGIIGLYWERIRLKALDIRKANGEFIDVLKQEEVKMQGGLVSDADALIVTSVDKKTNTVFIRVEEDKTGGAVLSTGQKALKALVDANEVKKPPVVIPGIHYKPPPHILAMLDDPKKLQVIFIKYDEVRAPSGIGTTPTPAPTPAPTPVTTGAP